MINTLIHKYSILILLSGIFIAFIPNITIRAANCITISNNAWNCGNPNPSDDLTVNHAVTIADNYDPTGNITINNGGYLTITGNAIIKNCTIIIEQGGTLKIQGNAEFSSNSSVTCKGDMIFNNLLTIIETSANFVIQGGMVSSDGNILVTNGAKLEVGTGSTLFTHNSIEFNSNGITVFGMVNTEGDFTNNKHITGTGTIQYIGTCEGNGTINGISATSYCGIGLIDLSSLGCGTDTVDPIISDMPSDITDYAAAGSCGVSVAWIAPAAFDNCSLQSFNSPMSSGEVFPVGMTQVTYTATDAVGNSSSASFNISILDTISPSISNIPANIFQNVDVGACGASVTWSLPIAADNCSASLSSTHYPGDFFEVGTTTVSYTAMDVNGNSTMQSFDVIVVDKDPPIFISCPTEFVVESIDTVSNKSIISWIAPKATDNCSEVTLSSNFNPGDDFSLGPVTITYTAIDQSGNTSECGFEINSGINHAPVVQSTARKATSGEPIDIFIDAYDPEDNRIYLASVSHNEQNSVITNIDEEALSFTYTSFEYFHGFDTVFVKISDAGIPVKRTSALIIIKVERKMVVEVSSAITINGDMINHQWHLSNIDLFPNNTVHIYDRWGGMIYSAHGYDNTDIVWSGNGHNSKSHQEFVPAGTYFYVIDLGNSMDKLTGAVEVIR